MQAKIAVYQQLFTGTMTRNHQNCHRKARWMHMVKHASTQMNVIERVLLGGYVIKRAINDIQRKKERVRASSSCCIQNGTGVGIRLDGKMKYFPEERVIEHAASSLHNHAVFNPNFLSFGKAEWNGSDATHVVNCAEPIMASVPACTDFRYSDEEMYPLVVRY
jgi:hypothetical protein